MTVKPQPAEFKTAVSKVTGSNML